MTDGKPVPLYPSLSVEDVMLVNRKIRSVYFSHTNMLIGEAYNLVHLSLHPGVIWLSKSFLIALELLTDMLYSICRHRKVFTLIIDYWLLYGQLALVVACEIDHGCECQKSTEPRYFRKLFNRGRCYAIESSQTHWFMWRKNKSSHPCVCGSAWA